MNPRSEQEFLRHLRERGARRLRRVSFRRNRRTLWSLTQGGAALNVHVAYRAAPDEILDAFAVLARNGGRGSEAADRARARVRAWPGVREGLQRIRAEHARRAAADGTRRPSIRCAGSEEQRAWLRAAYGYLNRTRFQGRLPEDLPLRFSRRMRSSLGHMRPGTEAEGQRRAVEIALNLDLVLAGNEDQLLDTLLHEMAHAADWLFDGARGHGSSWRRWAARAGCVVRTRHEGGFRRRRRRDVAVTRVPPTPRRLLEPAGLAGPNSPLSRGGS